MTNRSTWMSSAVLVLVLATGLVAPGPVRAQERDTDKLVSGSALRNVEVRDVRTADGVITGVIANNSPNLLRDVRLMVHHNWFWKDELHPGDDNPGRVSYYTVPEEILPGKTLRFTYRPQPPLPERDDGHFTTAMSVVGYTEVGRAAR
jgi:hypothetical protein